MRKKLLILAIWFLAILAATAQAPAPDSPEVENRVNSILSKMTLEEKIDILGGVNTFDVRAYPKLGLPALSTADGPIGVRNDGPSTVMAGGISLAATWNPELAERVGVQLGKDARAKGKHFLLGPGVNIYRSPLNGRNFEYFGEDPFLASRIAVAYIKGVQSQGVSATIKHFTGNNSEFARHDTDSVIDERTLREIYLPAFEAAVKEAHVGAIMDSYNLTNGQHMTQNGRLNNDLLKREWGFTGIVMSDWDATYDSVAAANGGLDLEMPSGKFLNRNALLPAIKNGTVSEATVDDKVRRILRTEVKFGWPDRPQADYFIPRFNESSRSVALEAAREGIVLLKNEGNLLPLSKGKIKTIAIIGPDAHPAQPVGGGSAQVGAFQAQSLLVGLSNYLGSAANVLYVRGVPGLNQVALDTNFSTAAANGKPGVEAQVFDNVNLSGKPVMTGIIHHMTMGIPSDLANFSSGDTNFDVDSLKDPHRSSRRWTGYYTAQSSGVHEFFVQLGGFGDGGFRLYVDGKMLINGWEWTPAVADHVALRLSAGSHKIVLEHHSDGGFGGPFLRLGIKPQGTWTDPAAEQIADKADAVILAVGFDPSTETEGMDRTFELPPGQDELIQKVSAANNNTIVVVTSGGGFDMQSWLEKVPALLESWYAGQEGGRALAEILFGEVNPSGHLAATFERRWEDNPAHDNYYPPAGSNRVTYKEGIFVGYRGYQHTGTKPAFPFGYGLSYTTFKFDNLAVKPVSTGVSAGSQYVATFDVTNTGKQSGAQVAQVYVGTKSAKVPEPVEQLKGFARVNLQPGETQKVSVPLDGRSFAYYDVASKEWKADAGAYSVLVGDSSDHIALTGSIDLPAAVAAK